ncbi:hypothetical protein Pla123a_28020 [Posidoniimonas polymericola]|uniref:Helix-turn-helix domain protein n=1 Tax=Posidoniimonas polymericola TaxID=2528002 RepID=A0A5C5YME0_9BACT|nr:helix-turn-helix domain-containing protein [Posidoniimonas polymericola]TWT76016.1 hypothetical protein Pla123a_28020 [Posidoniimonas polymericola]
MANKFIGLEDAATQLGISKDQLNEIRESGKVRAYRDGASWKFRTEEIDSLVEDIKSGNLPSGIDLGDSISLDSDESTGLSSLALASESDSIEIDEPAEKKEASAEVSDLDLAALDEPTVEAEGDDDNESILLSEEELGDSPDRPPSTIIGRSQLRNEPSDDDLQFASPDEAAGMSDVRLADDDDLLGASGSGAGKFEDLEELEFDLEAESSRILEAQDIAAAQAAAKSAAEESAVKPKADAPSGMGSELSLESLDEGSSASGAPAASDAFSLAADEDDELELDLAASDAGLQSGSDLQSDGSDDMVLDASDDDFTLSGGDSGINLKPSDSGLALDDGSFALGGSSLGSSLDLGDSLAASGDSLAIGGASEVSLEGSTAFASSPDFNLQPSDDGDDEDEDDSSQIIALDAVEEPGLEEDDEVQLTDASAVTMGVPGATASPVMAQEAVFPVWIVAFLGLSAMLMAVSAIMAADLLRTMWAWDEPYSLGSPLIEGFLGLIGMNN